MRPCAGRRWEMVTTAEMVSKKRFIEQKAIYCIFVKRCDGSYYHKQ